MRHRSIRDDEHLCDFSPAGLQHPRGQLPRRLGRSVARDSQPAAHSPDHLRPLPDSVTLQHVPSERRTGERRPRVSCLFSLPGSPSAGVLVWLRCSRTRRLRMLRRRSTSRGSLGCRGAIEEFQTRYKHLAKRQAQFACLECSATYFRMPQRRMQLPRYDAWMT